MNYIMCSVLSQTGITNNIPNFGHVCCESRIHLTDLVDIEFYFFYDRPMYLEQYPPYWIEAASPSAQRSCHSHMTDIKRFVSRARRSGFPSSGHNGGRWQSDLAINSLIHKRLGANRAFQRGYRTSERTLVSGRWGLFPIVDYTGRLHPTRIPFSGWRYMKGVPFPGWKFMKGVPFLGWRYIN